MSEQDIKIGLALGAGGSRGLAHIGVLEFLQKEGINIDMVAGTSIGSLIGGLFACGLPLKYVKGLARGIQWDQITDVTFPRLGLLKGEKLFQFVELITKKKDIEDLDLPYAAVSCDIENGEMIVLKEGSLASAIRASTSIPGIFVPYSYRGKKLVDGGVLERVPVNTVREMGADIVIAVDVGINNICNSVENMFDVLFNAFDIVQNQYESLRKLNCEVVIRPELKELSPFDLDQVDYCIDAGYREAETKLDEIKYLIEERIVCKKNA